MINATSEGCWEAWSAIAHAKGETERARELHEQSRDILESLGDELGVAHADVNLGDICFNLGNYDEGRALSQIRLGRLPKVGRQTVCCNRPDHAWSHCPSSRVSLGKPRSS